MTYGEYQQYLVDGGWLAVSRHKEQIEGLEQQIAATDALYQTLLHRVERLERDQWANMAIAIVLLLSMCVGFILLLTGVP